MLADGAIASFSYDDAGNRTNSGDVTGTGNQLLNDGTWTYTYDTAGNVISKSQGTGGNTWTYSYNFRNEMTSAVETDSSSSVLVSIAYGYDVYGNLIHQSTTTGAGTVTNQFVVDGWDVLGQNNGPGNWPVLLQLDGDGNLLYRYLGSNTESALMRVDSSNTINWLVTDRQGSLVQVTDVSGTVLDQLSYDAYGNITAQSDAANGDIHGWSGRLTDSETGFQLAGLQMYDPASGRYLNPNPEGLQGGDVNLYRFEGNDPTQLPQPDSSDSMDASAGSMPGAPSSDGVFPTLDVRLSLSPTDPSTWQDPDELDQSSSLPDPDQYSGLPLGAGFNLGMMPAPQGPVFDPGSIAAQLSTPVNPFTLATPSNWMLPTPGALDGISDYAKLASRVLTLAQGIDPTDIVKQLAQVKVVPPDDSFFRLLYAQTGLRSDPQSTALVQPLTLVRSLLGDPSLARPNWIQAKAVSIDSIYNTNFNVVAGLIDREWIRQYRAKQRLTAEPGTIEWLNQLANIRSLTVSNVGLRYFGQNGDTIVDTVLNRPVADLTGINIQNVLDSYYLSKGQIAPSLDEMAGDFGHTMAAYVQQGAKVLSQAMLSIALPFIPLPLAAGLSFLYGGLSGETDWDGKKALGGLVSGLLMRGGTLLAGSGRMSLQLTGSFLSGFGSSSFNTLQPGQGLNWNTYWKEGLAGGASSLASSAVSLGVNRLTAAPGTLPPLWAQGLSGGLSSMTGTGVSLALRYQLGLMSPEEIQQLTLNNVAGRLVGSFGGGVAGGVLNGLATNRLIYQNGPNAGKLMCGVTQQQYMLRHAIGGGLGAAGGDVVSQLLEYSFLSDDEKQNWSFDWGRLVNNTVHGAVQSAMHARMQYANLLKACFCAGTPLRTMFGSKPIEEIQAGEWIVSRDESNPDGLLMAKQVEEVFVRTGRVWHLHVGGQLIRTTGEHPFYVKGRGWVAALELLPGDLLATEDGQWVPVEEVYDTGEYETVYNLRVADFHTYFVGSVEWGFSVWAT